ncbi:hypothetical protein pb186bvf_008020 [Paramecium bursaria]
MIASKINGKQFQFQQKNQFHIHHISSTNCISPIQKRSIYRRFCQIQFIVVLYENFQKFL